MDYEHPEPIDIVAVRVTRFKGVPYHEFTIRDKTTDFIPDIKQLPIWYGIKDYTGLVYGNGLLVIGYIGQNGKSKKHASNERHMWAVKCLCGRIIKRQSKTISKAIRNGNSLDKCEFCHKIENFRKK